MTGRKNRMFVFSVCLAVAAALAAVFFSSQPGTQSQGLSRGIVAWFLDFFHLDVSQEIMGWINYFLRRGAHLFIYFCMGLGLTGAFSLQKRLPAWLPAIILGVVFAATDEYHQLFSGGRSGKPGDVILDSCGLALGCFVSYLIKRCMEKRENENEKLK